MKFKISFLAFWLIFAYHSPGFGGMSSASYSIKSSVFPGGGAPMMSASFRNNDTIGQTIASEPVSSSTYDLYPGFWYTMNTSCCIWDIEPDGDVDGIDLYLFINPPYSASDIEGFGFEFGRTDCP